MGTVGDPKIDLAGVVQSWPDETVADEEPSGYVDMTHLPTPSQILERHAAVSGRQVDHIDYPAILANWNLAIAPDPRVPRATHDPPEPPAYGPALHARLAGAAAPAATTDNRRDGGA